MDITMAVREKSRIANIITNTESVLLENWVREQLDAATKQQGRIREQELREQCSSFLRQFSIALQGGNVTNVQSQEWTPIRKILSDISRSRGEQGFSPSETAIFVFSLKKPLFVELRNALAREPEVFAAEIWAATELLDKLGLYTTEIYQKVRDEVIARQQQDMLELSTPVVSLAEGILALPLIGTLDSSRTQIVMESLLERIVATGSTVAIIDITGVPTVDTLVAQHLLKTVTAARLMGADCIISGIRPQIAQTIVHLGVDLGNVVTKATLSSAFKLALERNNMMITRISTKSAVNNLIKS